MSQNVEIVREVVSLMDFAARADDLPPRLLDLTAPEVQIDMSRRVSNPYEIAESFSEFRMEPDEFIDAGDYVA